MACALTQGYTLDCKDSLGGLKSVLFIESENVSVATESAGVVTDISLAVGKYFYKYELVKETSMFMETVTASVQNGTIFYAQELTIVLNKLQANTRNEILLLAKNNLVAIVEDKNGKYWYLGQDGGLDITGGTAGSGTAAGDRNGYELTFSGQEKELAPEVSSSIIGGLID
ncbi:hypothetical protein UFOVP384_1 [uncultured Caudovirales phage]|uniref:Uncharacterized protein n=1 Tax=uncultured Caudovirales phage TaxID=2100421 RepID=A0A6J7WYS3_9CAUD|nr:hypothetical protein UFOVP384_1 [uncultured Caudovirales phage]